jgi:hypothetical protein
MSALLCVTPCLCDSVVPAFCISHRALLDSLNGSDSLQSVSLKSLHFSVLLRASVTLWCLHSAFHPALSAFMQSQKFLHSSIDLQKRDFSPTRSSVAGAALCLHSVVIYPESRGTVTAFCIHPALSILPISKVPSLFNRSPKKRFFSAALCCHSVSAVKCISN